MAIKWPYENRGGYLYVDGAATLDLARRFGTPLYVYSENLIRSQYRRARHVVQGLAGGLPVGDRGHV